MVYTLVGWDFWDGMDRAEWEQLSVLGRSKL